MNKTDHNLIWLVAEMWVEHGGDAEGFDWCLHDLKSATQSIIDERKKRDEGEVEVEE